MARRTRAQDDVKGDGGSKAVRAAECRQTLRGLDGRTEVIKIRGANRKTDVSGDELVQLGKKPK
jgi:hypothetical protein